MVRTNIIYFPLEKMNNKVACEQIQKSEILCKLKMKHDSLSGQTSFVVYVFSTQEQNKGF
jgi:hypothetical protein